MGQNCSGVFFCAKNWGFEIATVFFRPTCCDKNLGFKTAMQKKYFQTQFLCQKLGVQNFQGSIKKFEVQNFNSGLSNLCVCFCKNKSFFRILLWSSQKSTSINPILTTFDLLTFIEILYDRDLKHTNSSLKCETSLIVAV